METGSLAEWYVAEGDSFGAGDALAKIETDKASIDFEAQDDGYVAKLLADTGVDLPVGAPILVTVEEEEDVAAFKDFVAPVAEVSAAVEEPKVEAAPAPPAPEPVVEVAAPVTEAPPPAAIAAPAATASEGSVAAVAWGQSVVTASPLAKTLAAAQNSYLSKYGTTGQRPIL
jgi:pyruvate dehydrogenase E2 component (dihydrolipoamide acetyltransferase)